MVTVMVVMVTEGWFNYGMEIGINFYFTFNQKVDEHGFQYFAFTVSLLYLSECQFTCRLQEDQEAEEEEEEDLQQPVFGVGGESRHTIHAKKHFQNPCYHYNLHYYNLTFIITVLKVKN